jgi:hypothetical protein
MNWSELKTIGRTLSREDPGGVVEQAAVIQEALERRGHDLVAVRREVQSSAGRRAGRVRGQRPPERPAARRTGAAAATGERVVEAFGGGVPHELAARLLRTISRSRP